MLAELDAVLAGRDAFGRPVSKHLGKGAASGAQQPLLEALVSTKCTAEEALVPLLVLRSRQLRGVENHTEPVVWLPPSVTSGVSDGLGPEGAVTLREVRAVLAATHSPQTLCGAKRGCACPSALQWPATKFLVKRVSRAPSDPGGVRAFLTTLAGRGSYS